MRCGWDMGDGDGRLGKDLFFCGSGFVAKLGVSSPPVLDVKGKERKDFAFLAVAGSQDQPSLPPCFEMEKLERVMTRLVFYCNVDIC